MPAIRRLPNKKAPGGALFFYSPFYQEVGGAKRDRTADLYNAIVALSQLSYSPPISRSPRRFRRGATVYPSRMAPGK